MIIVLSSVTHGKHYAPSIPVHFWIAHRTPGDFRNYVATATGLDVQRAHCALRIVLSLVHFAALEKRLGVVVVGTPHGVDGIHDLAPGQKRIASHKSLTQQIFKHLLLAASFPVCHDAQECKKFLRRIFRILRAKFADCLFCALDSARRQKTAFVKIVCYNLSVELNSVDGYVAPTPCTGIHYAKERLAPNCRIWQSPRFAPHRLGIPPGGTCELSSRLAIDEREVCNVASAAHPEHDLVPVDAYCRTFYHARRPGLRLP